MPPNGIGLAAAEALAALGDNIVIVGRNETRTKIAAARISISALIIRARSVGLFPRIHSSTDFGQIIRRLTNDSDLNWAFFEPAAWIHSAIAGAPPSGAEIRGDAGARRHGRG